MCRVVDGPAWLHLAAPETVFFCNDERIEHASPKGRAMNKPVNQKAWLLVVPVFICVAFSAILPLMTVVNYSVQDIIGPTQHVFVGTEWFRNIMTDPDLRGALGRQIIFSAVRAAVRDPARRRASRLRCRRHGWRASAALVMLAMPLLIPWNVVGTIWQIFGAAGYRSARLCAQ